jgi:amidophosphoribosyltransferase
MSDEIKHECGIALIRLKKPLEYYKERYDSSLYGLDKLYLLMEKQHNRGQDGAGVAVVKFDPEIGTPYIFRERMDGSSAIGEIFRQINQQLNESKFIDENGQEQEKYIKMAPFVGELMLGHLRYATHSAQGINFCHPFIRQNNWMSKNLVLAGNFNLTNNEELFHKLIELGQHPSHKFDTVTVLEKIGHFLDEEVENLYQKYKEEGLAKQHVSELIEKELDVENILRRAAKDFDGGYAIAGLIGNGDAFVLRDPNGIRPAFWYEDDDVVVVTSERPAIQTAFNISWKKVQEIKRGHALIIKKNGEVSMAKILPERELLQCSFERVYFSRGTDRDIYQERKQLGRNVAPAVLEAINYDLENTVFSYIPNTAEVSFLGMLEAVDDYLNTFKKQEILKGELKEEKLNALLAFKPRVEKIAVKDTKLRTFITNDEARKDMVSHVYDTTYGIIRNGVDTLVVIDDSIVRGTTLRNSILRMLDRLHPKKIIIVSSAPQIRFPDCYGIDMSKLKEFVAFWAAVELLKERGEEGLMQEVYLRCKENVDVREAPNYVNEIYHHFSYEEISNKIGSMLRNEHIEAEVQIIYQTVEGLHEALPNHKGDWYFTGRFPTPGGNRVANRSFVNYYEGIDARAY